MTWTLVDKTKGELIQEVRYLLFMQEHYERAAQRTLELKPLHWELIHSECGARADEAWAGANHGALHYGIQLAI